LVRDGDSVGKVGEGSSKVMKGGADDFEGNLETSTKFSEDGSGRSSSREGENIVDMDMEEAVEKISGEDKAFIDTGIDGRFPAEGVENGLEMTFEFARSLAETVHGFREAPVEEAFVRMAFGGDDENGGSGG
jgi:hypothetical protein